MSDFDRPASTLYERPARRRPAGNRIGDRLARTFGGFERTRAEVPEWESDGELEYVEDETQVVWEPQDARYPRSRNGYDPMAVDRHVAELEREVAMLRTREPAESVATEIERIGEKTSSILLLAHDQAQEIKRDAQEQADRCLADAAGNAVKITEDAKRRLRQLDLETDAVWQERTRLLLDARNVATALFTLVEEAAERFPAEGERTQPVPISAEASEPATSESDAIEPGE